MNQRSVKSSRRSPAHWLGLFATVAMLGGLLVPITAAEAAGPTAVPAAVTFGKPTSVNASKISGSNGLKVSWKAPSGGTPAAYKVTWGKSSSADKATYATYTTGTSAYLSGPSMDTSTYYYVWVQPWSEASGSGTATGLLSSSDKVKTSSFGYKAPVEIHAVNATKTSMEVTWRTVTGSPGYVLRAYNYTTGKYSYQVGYDGSAIFTGLTPNTKYKFTVANRLLISGYDVVPGVRVSGWSSKSSTKTTNPTSVTLADGTTSPMRDVPTGLTLTARDSSSITLSWQPPSGYNSSTDSFRVYWAEDQEMTDHDGYTATPFNGTSGKVTGLSSNTNYYVRIRMVRQLTVNGVTSVAAISDRTQAIMVKTTSPKGYVSGTVSGVSGTVLDDYMAIAYSRTSSGPGDIKGTANVSSSGNYKLSLRPGTYFVQLSYVGTGNYTTQWLTSDASDAYASADVGTYGAVVALDKTTTVANVSVGEGGILTGTVANAAGSKLGSVYVSARTSWDGNKEVVDQTSTDSSGSFTLRGLPPGKTVWVRANGSAIGYAAKTITDAQSVPSAGNSRSVGTIELATK